ncbi:MAG: 4-hydroxythreonine-4-phosphate dehydrogenase PdxA [Citromicrobium sp.]|nr:4-hydroxythreonine-4-phosphate dehydrogenase PdxA [Citromicrobium sp.]
MAEPANAPRPLAISLGDPAGIGPELIAESWARREELALPPFFTVHGREVLLAAAQARGFEIAVEPIASPDHAARVFPHALPVLGERDGAYRPGEPDREGAALALASLEDATMLAVSGSASGVVTAPIAKGRLAEVGFTRPGQTEFVSALSGAPADKGVMMLAGPSLRVVPLSVHVALRDVVSSLSTELIVARGEVVADALRRDFGIAQPRLAVTGLNPHAGEGGRFGDEEATIIEPAIARLRDAGVDASGPFAADGLFSPPMLASFDAALCMYHDQALIPFKALAFEDGVNVTLGLPVVRTSPDHGTAFAIAGKRQASAMPTIAAIRMAGEIARRRASIHTHRSS